MATTGFSLWPRLTRRTTHAPSLLLADSPPPFPPPTPVNTRHLETPREHRTDPDRRWWVEIVGYWTRDYLTHKLASYRAAKLPRVILCVDARRSLVEHELPRDARLVRFEKRVSVEENLAIIEAS